MVSINPLSVLLLVAGVNARTVTFKTQSANFTEYPGLYQSSFSDATGKLYVTNSVGRPPVKVSDLLEVDPDTLKVLKDEKPAFDKTNLTQIYAVYGVDVDDSKKLAWVTNTRQATVAYYNLNDLSLGNQYPIGDQKQPRDVYVDSNTGNAWVSGARSDVVTVYSSDHKEGPIKSLNISKAIGKTFDGVMSLVADEEAKVLYTVSLSSNLAAAINLTSYDVKSFDLGKNVKSPSGVAWDSKRKHLYIANQKSNNTIVLDPSTGKIVKDIALPAGPLNARYDPTFDLVYVANRLGHSVSVIDPEDYSIITELKVPTPNHISLGRNGEVFVTDKSNASLLFKFTPEGAKNSSSSSNSTSSPKASGSGAASGTGHPKAVNGASTLAVPGAIGALAAVAMLI